MSGPHRQGAPVLIWPVARPTDRSAMKLSSVSPDLWLAMTPQPASLAILTAMIDSVTVPIWFTYIQMPLSGQCPPEWIPLCILHSYGTAASKALRSCWHVG